MQPLEDAHAPIIGLADYRELCTSRLSVRAWYDLDMTVDNEFDINVARLVSQLRQAPDIRRIDNGS